MRIIILYDRTKYSNSLMIIILLSFRSWFIVTVIRQITIQELDWLRLFEMFLRRKNVFSSIAFYVGYPCSIIWQPVCILGALRVCVRVSEMCQKKKQQNSPHATVERMANINTDRESISTQRRNRVSHSTHCICQKHWWKPADWHKQILFWQIILFHIHCWANPCFRLDLIELVS